MVITASLAIFLAGLSLGMLIGLLVHCSMCKCWGCHHSRDTAKTALLHRGEHRELLELLRSFFLGDEEKVNAWFTTRNPNFGCSPATMIEMGRYEKLLKWAREQIAENKPDNY